MRPKIIVLVVIALIIWTGLLGYWIGIKNPRTIVIKGLDNLESGVVVNADMRVFWETWEVIKDKYLRAAAVGNQDLIYGGAGGLLEALDDPYSSFFNPADAKKLNEDLGGSFGGIGAEIGFKKEQLIIVAPLKSSPAEKAGLLAGDKILEINGESTAGININEAVKKIRGVPGTQVNLTIGRDGAEKSKKVTINREIINIPVLEWTMKNDNLAHLQLFTFNEKSPNLTAAALKEIISQGGQGAVLDLRNNPGGFLESAIAVAGLFLEAGKEVVFEEFRSGKKEVFIAGGGGLAKNLPLVILVNSGSASASEILVGALRDHRGVKIVGEKTFGKGTVQELQTLSDGSTIKITIAEWVLPKGQKIDKTGIEPDVKVEITDEEREAKKDPQLDKALEILKSQISK